MYGQYIQVQKPVMIIYLQKNTCFAIQVFNKENKGHRSLVETEYRLNWDLTGPADSQHQYLPD